MDTLVFVHSQDSCQDLMICFAYPIRLLDGYLWVINGYHGVFRLLSFFCLDFGFLRILVLTLVLQIYLMASLKALVTSVAVNEIRDVYDRYQITMSLAHGVWWIDEDQRGSTKIRP